MTRVALITALLALIACPAAAAHGGGAAKGYRSTVERITPSIPGVSLRVLDGDDQLELTDTAGRRVVVLGYDGEPYLLFTRRGVYRNERSPATYLNDDRYGKVDVPTSADPKASPRWKAVAAGVGYAWHDHRIHWMSPIAPPAVRTAKEQPHHIFDWRVPAMVDGRRVAITGSLDYTPPDAGGLPPWVFAMIGVVLAGLIGLGVLLLIRRRPSRARKAPDQHLTVD
jgi:hypothetical protein